LKKILGISIAWVHSQDKALYFNWLKNHMPESPELDQSLKLTSSENYVSREEFFRVIDYLLLSQLNAQTSLRPGAASKHKLRELFLRLIAILQPTVFCDIGSRDGESAIQVNRLLPDCECYAFEANPKIYQQFHSRMKNSICPGIVRIACRMRKKIFIVRIAVTPII